MKYRTDFVTNSSSSSFVLVVCVTDQNGDPYSVKTTLFRNEVERIRDRNPASGYSSVTSKDSLVRLLDMLGLSYPARSNLLKNMPPMKETKQIDISLVWDSHGESSGLTVHNDTELRKRAEAFLNSKGEEREKARAALVDHLDNTPVYAEGAWVDETWPVAFFGDSGAEARYGWDNYRDKLEKLAGMIAKDDICGDDLGIETLTILPGEKKITHHAELVIDGKRDILKPKRPKKKAEDGKKAEPVEPVSFDTVDAGQAPEIRLGDYTFSYETIDSVPESFYAPVFDQEGNIRPVKNCTEEIGNFKVSVHLAYLAGEAAKMYSGKDDKIWLIPEKFVDSICRWDKEYEMDRNKPFVPDPEDILSQKQLSVRSAVFLRLMHLCTNKAILKMIAEAYPKKKNGLFHKGRVLKIAWLYAVNVDQKKSEIYNGFETNNRIYQLYAKAESDTELDVTVRLYHMINIDDMIGTDDLAVQSNLFSKEVLPG